MRRVRRGTPKPLLLEADRKPTLTARARAELASFWDTDLAIAGAIAAGVLGLAQITELETTVALTLAVLAAVAGALHRDRSSRAELQRSVAELDSRLASVSRAHSNPLPFDVIDATYRWEFDKRGEVARVRKRARVRCVHNGVWTILAWHTKEENIRRASAHLFLRNDATHRLQVFDGLDMGDGKRGKLIGLDRQYKQNQVLDYEYRFESHGNFPAKQEWIDIAIETFTANLSIEIVWPSKRVPSVVWRDVDGEPELPIETALDGRKVTRIRLENRAAGESLSIRWLWRSSASLQKKKRRTR